MKDLNNLKYTQVFQIGDNMKKLLLILTAFAVSCSLFADSRAYNVDWQLNSEEDMDHYNLYVWQGTDTLQCPFVQNGPADNQYFIKAIPHPDIALPAMGNTNFIGTADGVTYLSVAMTAVDKAGNPSLYGWGTNSDSNNGSHFLLSVDVTPPTTPEVTFRSGFLVQ